MKRKNAVDYELNTVLKDLRKIHDEFALYGKPLYNEELANNEVMLNKAIEISWLAKDIYDYFTDLFEKNTWQIKNNRL